MQFGSPYAERQVVIMNILIVIVIIGLLGFVFLVNKAASKSIEAMSHPDDMLEVLENIEDRKFIESCDEFKSWIDKKGCIHECDFLFHTINENEVIQCSAWWSKEVKSWTLIYFAQGKQTIDFVTIYDDNIAVTTSSNKDSILLPDPPKAYKQAFTDLTYEQLYEKHLQGRNFVEYNEKVLPQINKQDLLTEVKKSLILQSKYIMNLPMWRFKGFYWYFVRRNLKVNKPISSSDRKSQHLNSADA